MDSPSSHRTDPGNDSATVTNARYSVCNCDLAGTQRNAGVPNRLPRATICFRDSSIGDTPNSTAQVRVRLFQGGSGRRWFSSHRLSQGKSRRFHMYPNRILVVGDHARKKASSRRGSIMCVVNPPETDSLESTGRSITPPSFRGHNRPSNSAPSFLCATAASPQICQLGPGMPKWTRRLNEVTFISLIGLQSGSSRENFANS